ncbi:MAG: branched-chain amino acid ABC transporter permease [Gulosibacter sp.]|uniref:branched-chain amino acid ABC transporter permease n=1 Tax=Gulosibacter sp. TaxID=2817531 RepID=UPI003F93DC17
MIDILIAGLSLGAVYSLVALGFVIIYKTSEVLNFAHGSFVVAGAYITARTSEVFGFFGAVVAGILGAALLAVIVERVLVRPIRDASIISLTIMTIGLEVILNTELVRQIGVDILPLGQPWGASSIMILGAAIPVNRLVAIATAVVIVVVFLLAFRYSSWGVSMRAAAEDRETAELLGMRLGKISIMSWLIAGALAAIAGIFLTGAPTPGLAPTLAAVAMRAFPAAIIGGLDSVGGALAGGMIIGLTEAIATGYQSQLEFLGRGIGDVMPFIVLIIVLVIRPQGLFGRKEIARA